MYILPCPAGHAAQGHKPLLCSLVEQESLRAVNTAFWPTHRVPAHHEQGRLILPSRTPCMFLWISLHNWNEDHNKKKWRLLSVLQLGVVNFVKTHYAVKCLMSPAVQYRKPCNYMHRIQQSNMSSNLYAQIGHLSLS